MTTVVISQPMLFPWPGFFEQLSLADVFVDYDDVQFSKGSFTNRIQLKWGAARRWMTIPLKGGGTFQRILDLEAASTDWRGFHRDLLTRSLEGAPYLEDALELFGRAYSHDRLCDLLIASIDEPAAYLGLRPARRSRSSTLDVPGNSTARVLDIVQAVGGDDYVTGHGAASYLDHAAFQDAGIDVRYMRYSLTPWPHPDPFNPYVSVLDLIAWTGKDATKHLRADTVTWREFLGHKQSSRL
jgi:hypothetical protein